MGRQRNEKNVEHIVVNLNNFHILFLRRTAQVLPQAAPDGGLWNAPYGAMEHTRFASLRRAMECALRRRFFLQGGM